MVNWNVLLFSLLTMTVTAQQRPNILFCISDDQSYAHAGANGDPVIQTPAFDRVAREGIRFTRAFCDAPTCGPSRSAILTGQHIWRLEEAGNIHSTLPAKFATYTEELQKAGYFIGHTGKGWSPGRDALGGRTENAAGPQFRKARYTAEKPKPPGVNGTPYAANFADFLGQRPDDAPFCFWLGTYEPHRGYQQGLWKDRDPGRVIVPPIFPDHDIVRRDILDYMHEIEHFDAHVGRAIAMLEKSGELDNTIVVVTSDHGMPFPRAKASLYDAGSHVPLAIRWPKGIKSPGRTYEGLVNLSDVAPTFLEAAGVARPAMMTASSLMDVFTSPGAAVRPNAFIAMERHDGCRKGGKGYPCRAIRTADFLYIRNYEPDRWPAGDPDRRVCARDLPYGEVDSSPTKTLMMANADKEGYKRLHELAFGKRPGVELYDLQNDPAQMNNVADDPEYAASQKRLATALRQHLEVTKDPRALGLDAPWDFYPYYGMRRNKDWAVDLRPGATRLPEPVKPAVKPFNLQPAVDTFAPGWTVSRCGTYRNVGAHKSFNGQGDVLVTHPLDRNTGCTLKRQLDLPRGKALLRLVVGHHKDGDWRLVVRANGRELLNTIVGPRSSTNGWAEHQIDLTAFAGKPIKVELVNQPNDWKFEHGLWDTIVIETK